MYMLKIIVWGEHWSSSDIFFSIQTKAVVIRHLYNEDGVNVPEDTISTVTDVSGAFDVCDLKTTEIKVPEVKFPEIKSEQQVRILDFLNRCLYFLLWCTWLLQHLNFGVSLTFCIITYDTTLYLRISKSTVYNSTDTICCLCLGYGARCYG